MQNLINRLGKKGWGKKEIQKAVGIIQESKLNKGKEIILFDRHIYWILLIVILAANFSISIALIPALVALNGAFLYFVVITLGIVFGLLFELVIRSIEHLERKHHIILAFLIPIVASVNMFVIARLSNNFKISMSLKNATQPIILAVVYAASFVLPYIIYRFVLKIEYYAKE